MAALASPWLEPLLLLSNLAPFLLKVDLKAGERECESLLLAFVIPGGCWAALAISWFPWGDTLGTREPGWGMALEGMQQQNNPNSCRFPAAAVENL